MIQVSRCHDAVNAPQTLWWAPVDGDARAVMRELSEAVDGAGLAPGDALDAKADIVALLKQVEARSLEDRDAVVPVRRDTALFDVRFQILRHDLCVRLHETEDPRLPGFLGHARSATAQMGMLGAVNIAMETLLYGSIGVFAGHFHTRVAGQGRGRRVLSLVAAGVYLLLAVVIGAEAVRDMLG